MVTQGITLNWDKSGDPYVNNPAFLSGNYTSIYENEIIS